jgi:hypothetical protein
VVVHLEKEIVLIIGIIVCIKVMCVCVYV